jgi:hypothetical protein
MDRRRTNFMSTLMTPLRTITTGRTPPVQYQTRSILRNARLEALIEEVAAWALLAGFALLGFLTFALAALF